MKNIDVIGIVALAFFLEKKENYIKAQDFFKQQKIKTIPSRNIDKKYYNSTATVEERVKDLEDNFNNNNIDMIVSLDGGCTVIELLNKIDYEKIRKNKKIFTGFSDLTHLQVAMYTKSNLPTLYGMDIINGFGNHNEFFKKNIDVFSDIVNNKIDKLENYDKVRILKEGKAKGILIGGWLTAIADLIDTEYWTQEKEIILFLEEVECEPHLININLQRIKLSKNMKNIKGIVFGDFIDCEEKEYWDCIPSIEEIILNTFKEYDIPIITNMSFGHGEKHLTIPIGIKAEINSEWNYIKLLEKFELGGN